MNTVLQTMWLEMPTGYHIAWKGQELGKLALKLATVADDLDLARRDPTIMLDGKADKNISHEIFGQSDIENN